MHIFLSNFRLTGVRAVGPWEYGLHTAHQHLFECVGRGGPSVRRGRVRIIIPNTTECWAEGGDDTPSSVILTIASPPPPHPPTSISPGRYTARVVGLLNALRPLQGDNNDDDDNDSNKDDGGGGGRKDDEKEGRGEGAKTTRQLDIL